MPVGITLESTKKQNIILTNIASISQTSLTEFSSIPKQITTYIILSSFIFNWTLDHSSQKLKITQSFFTIDHSTEFNHTLFQIPWTLTLITIIINLSSLTLKSSLIRTSQNLNSTSHHSISKQHTNNSEVARKREREESSQGKNQGTYPYRLRSRL